MTFSNMFGAPRFLVDADYHRIGSHLIQPFRPELVQPASYDVTLGPKVLFPAKPNRWDWGGTEYPLIDLRRVRPADHMEEVDIGDGYRLDPGGAALVSTAEQVSCPSDMICSVDGKSTIGRCFIAIHVTAGFIDPGYRGAVTLELVNHGPWPFVLYTGMRIGQLRFCWLGTQAEKPYGSTGLGSHYQGSESVRGAEGELERGDRH